MPRRGEEVTGIEWGRCTNCFRQLDDRMYVVGICSYQCYHTQKGRQIEPSAAAEAEGVLGLVCAVWAWREWKAHELTSEVEREMKRRDRSLFEIYEATTGVAGLIGAIYAWREAIGRVAGG